MQSAEKLRYELERYHCLRQHKRSGSLFNRRLHTLQEFQVRRLQHTHAALIADPEFRDATELFLEDIYGGIDLSQMAGEIERALPLAVRLLPESVLHVSAVACEAMVLTQELDERMVDAIFVDGGELTLDNYIAAFRATEPEQRYRQMELVRELGHGLDRYVRSRLIFMTFRLASGAAHRYGLGTLYDFLDRGFRVLRPMKSAHDIFDRICNAEEEIIARIADHHADPFLLGGKPL
jgi:hypothetical protein